LTDTDNLRSYKAAQQEIFTSLMVARATGNLPIDGQLKNALSVVSQDNSKFYSNKVDYQRDLYRTSNALVALSAMTTGAITDAQQQKTLLETQLTTLTDGFNAEQTRLDKIIETAEASFETGKGTYVVLSSIEQALSEFYGVAGMPGEYVEAPVANDTHPSRRNPNPNPSQNDSDYGALVAEIASLRAEIAKGNSYAKDTADATGRMNRVGVKQRT
jgi:hypothetical protein